MTHSRNDDANTSHVIRTLKRGGDTYTIDRDAIEALMRRVRGWTIDNAYEIDSGATTFDDANIEHVEQCALCIADALTLVEFVRDVLDTSIDDATINDELTRMDTNVRELVLDDIERDA